MKSTAAVLLLLVVAVAMLSPAAAVLPEDEMLVDVYRHAGPLFSASLQGGSCPKLQCAISVAKCSTAAIEAYTKKDISILLKCVDKDHVCMCVNCLPDAIAIWIKTAVGCSANAANSLFDGASPASASAKPLSRAAAAADDSESDFNAQDCANVVAAALGNKDQLASPLVRKCNVRLLALHHTLLTPSQAAHAPAGKPDHASGSSSGGGKSSPIHAQASVGGPFLDKCNCPNICIGGCIPIINTCAGVCA